MKTILAAIQKGINPNSESESAFAKTMHESLKLATWGDADLSVVGRLPEENSRFGMR